MLSAVTLSIYPLRLLKALEIAISHSFHRIFLANLPGFQFHICQQLPLLPQTLNPIREGVDVPYIDEKTASTVLNDLACAALNARDDWRQSMGHRFEQRY
jgi:hypothetical protein